MDRCIHDYCEFQNEEKVGWYRKCLKCGRMDKTPSNDGFTYENGFDD